MRTEGINDRRTVASFDPERIAGHDPIDRAALRMNSKPEARLVAMPDLADEVFSRLDHAIGLSRIPLTGSPVGGVRIAGQI